MTEVTISKMEWLQGVEAANNEAIEVMSATNPPLFWDDKEGVNRKALIQFMHVLYQGTGWRGKMDWLSSSKWAAAITQANVTGGIFRLKPTREEHAREHAAKDRKDGLNRHREQKPSMPAETKDEVKNKLRDMFDQLTGQSKSDPKPQSLTPAQEISGIPVDVDITEMAPEFKKKLIKGVSTDAYKLWLKRRAVFVHEQKYPNAPKTYDAGRN